MEEREFKIDDIEKVLSVEKTTTKAARKARSPILVIIRAFLLETAGPSLSYQKPIKRYDVIPTNSQNKTGLPCYRVL